jgi:zinc transport system ATP-binding protein
MTTAPVVQFEKVSFRYGRQPVLEDITLDVIAGDFLGIIGPNGSGKTTLLKLMLGLLEPDRGRIRLFGTEPAEARHLTGYVPQFSAADVTFPITVEEVAEMGVLTPRTILFRHPGRDRVRSALAAVGIEALAKTPFGELSGGQRQRCLIARALASNPRLLILDEPTSSVDTSVEQDFFELLKNLNKTMTIILVSHDIGFISSYVNRVACVNRRLTCHGIEQMDVEKIGKQAYSGAVSMLRHDCKL